MSIQVIDNRPCVSDPANMFEPFISAKENGIGVAVSRSIVEAHEESYGQKIIMAPVHDSHSSCPGEGCVRREAIESLSCLAYEEYVIRRAPIDCYHHPVHLLEYSIPATSD